MSETKTKMDDAFVMKVIQQATAEALRYASAYIEQHGDGYPCGFAWVNIKPARGQFVKVLKKMGIGRTDDFYGGYTIWNPSNHPTQNMDAKEAGARAFAEELRKYGVKCSVSTRMD